ncbi:MAG TPA: GNAT family N-acetyltransferase [Streptosporangiaceae bacterium]|jgi:GNAT superfamily N-acetyltransferase
MPSIHVRPFRRQDRDQLTALVNAHAAAVVPGAGASVATVLSHLERQPGETITDPWVAERATLVAEQHHAVVAAAHLLHYFADDRAGASCRGSGVIRWLLFWPGAPVGHPCWSATAEAAEALLGACLRQLAQWRVTRQDADGDLPVPGVFGVPEQWPHVRGLYRRAGFAPAGPTEVVYLARADELPHPPRPPLAGLATRRSVGMNGTRLSAVLDEQVAGYIEVDIFEGGERLPRHGGWADIGNLHVAPDYRRRGVATWLLAEAGSWLRLAQVSRLLDYAALGTDVDGQDYAGYRAFLAASGFTELTRTQRGWTRSGPDPVGTGA